MQILKDTEDISLTNSRLEQLYVVIDLSAAHMLNTPAHRSPLGAYARRCLLHAPQWIHHRQARSG